jgi:hypothetical protein
MGLCHDVSGDLDGHVLWAWKDGQNPCTIGNSFINLTPI